MRRLFSQIAIGLTLNLPMIAYAQSGAPTDFKSLAGMVVKVLNALTTLAIGVAIFYYLLGVTRSIADTGSAKGWERLRNQAVWGIFAIFLMVAIWAILNLISNALFGVSSQGGTSPGALPPVTRAA